MSVYNKPDFKSKIGSNTPSFVHKKNNSLNFSTNTGRFLQENVNKLVKNKLELNNTQNNNTENNIVNHNNYMNSNSNINKLLTTTNKNNRKIEINLNKNYSPTSRLNKTSGDNIILLKHKQCTSQTNINHNKITPKENNNKECNIIINNNINNEKEKNNEKNKNLNNINININISKKIISTYYNKSKDKNNLIIKKKSINSVNNSEAKECDKKTYYKINTREDIKQSKNENIEKNRSTSILKKFSNKNSSLNNINGKENKSSVNLNSLGHFSTNSNMSTNTNKNNYSKTNINNSKNNNVLKSNHINYTSNDIYNIDNLNDKENNKKTQGNIANKITKENKSMYLSQIQIPINSSSPRNINSIQNYLKYLHIGQKNSPQNKSKNQKLSANNINFTHNHTENNVFENIYNNTYNYEYNNAFTQNNYKYNKKNLKDIPKGENKNKNNNNIKEKSEINIGSLSKKIKKSSQKISDLSYISENKGIDGISIENPEELHYFFVKIFQKGKNIDFDKKK